MRGLIALLSLQLANAETVETCSAPAMVQVQTRRASESSCAPLSNKGMYFTARICIGTPSQCFDMVADTGSDNVIVTSCVCDDFRGTGCSAHEKCFHGTNRSSSFRVDAQPIMESITFGSGTVETAVASDVVQLSSIKANMSEGLLLIINKADLDIQGELQGILGLGVPKSSGSQLQSEDTAMGQINSLEGDEDAQLLQPSRACMLFPGLCNASYQRSSPQAPNHELFMHRADVSRFSVCFRDAGQPGSLRTGITLQKPMPNIGQQHWGVSFEALAVALRHSEPQSAQQLPACGAHAQQHGTRSPCGIIPDSGTTMITGPTEGVRQLKAKICDEWPRCKALGKPSAENFQALLLDCASWLSEKGLEEVPSIYFTAHGHRYELTSWAWITASDDVCFSLLEEMDYFTAENGPVWIFGSPLFYEYVVGFDQENLQVSFERRPCNACGGVELLEQRPPPRLPRRGRPPQRPMALEVHKVL